MALLDLDFSKEKRRVWLQAACAALEGGQNGELAVDNADSVMLAFDARWGAGDKAVGTFKLAVALKYFERSALIGQEVQMLGNTDVPMVGKIRDFSNPGPGHVSGSVLVKWDAVDADPEGQWVGVEALQLLDFVEPKIPQKLGVLEQKNAQAA